MSGRKWQGGSLLPILWANEMCLFECKSGKTCLKRPLKNRQSKGLKDKCFLDLNLSITNGIISSKFYDKRDDFNSEIILNFPFLDGNVPHSSSYGVYYFATHSFCESVF